MHIPEEFVPDALDELAASWDSYGVTFEHPQLGEVPVPTWQEYPLASTTNFRSGAATNLGELVQGIRADVDNMKTLNNQADSQQLVSSANVVASDSFDNDSALGYQSVVIRKRLALRLVPQGCSMRDVVDRLTLYARSCRLIDGGETSEHFGHSSRQAYWRQLSSI
jgi:hypothetical protein